jgi:hypothetical protein
VPPWPAPLHGRAPADADAAQIAEAVATVWLEIDRVLHPIIGHKGVAALYGRSLNLTVHAFPWLGVGRNGVLATLDASAITTAVAQQAPADAAIGACALFQSFRDVLVSLIGPVLTDQLLGAIWTPPAPSHPHQDISS